MICTKFSSTITKVTIDIDFKFGTLAERTDKQPGPPGTQQDSAWYVADAPTMRMNVIKKEKDYENGIIILHDGSVICVTIVC